VLAKNECLRLSPDFNAVIFTSGGGHRAPLRCVKDEQVYTHLMSSALYPPQPDLTHVCQGWRQLSPEITFGRLTSYRL
jgi:hypothetical protein